MSEQRIIVTGTPIDGFTYIGPFDSFESAESYADHIGVMGDWWITTLQSPGTPELPLHYPGAAIPIPPAATHVHRITGELVTVTGHVNGITIFDSPVEEGEELLDEVFAEQYEPITLAGVIKAKAADAGIVIEQRDGYITWHGGDRQDEPVPTNANMVERLNWLHSNVQELQDRNVELPMGDFNDVYSIIEDARERFES